MAVNDLVQQVIMLTQLQQQRQAAEVARRTAQVGQLEGLMRLARQTRDPQLLDNLVQTGAQMGLDPDTLTQLFQHTAPTGDVLPQYATQQGLRIAEGTATAPTPEAGSLFGAAAAQNLTGQSRLGLATDEALTGMFGEGMGGLTPDARQRMAEGLVVRAASGLTPGAFARDTAVAGMSPEALGTAAEMELGLRPTAAQEQGFGLQFAGLEQRAQEHADQMALALSQQNLAERRFIFEAGLSTEELNVRKLQAQQKGVDINPIMEDYGKHLQFLQENKDGMSQAELQRRLDYINMRAAQIESALGLLPWQADAPEGTRMGAKPLSTDDVLQPGRIFGYPGIGR